jgi:hypothetical protein
MLHAAEAEELVENWDTAATDRAAAGEDENEAVTELQYLLAEHHEIGERILDY